MTVTIMHACAKEIVQPTSIRELKITAIQATISEVRLDPVDDQTNSFVLDDVQTVQFEVGQNAALAKLRSGQAPAGRYTSVTTKARFEVRGEVVADHTADFTYVSTGELILTSLLDMPLEVPDLHANDLTQHFALVVDLNGLFHGGNGALLNPDHNGNASAIDESIVDAGQSIVVQLYRGVGGFAYEDGDALAMHTNGHQLSVHVDDFEHRRTVLLTMPDDERVAMFIGASGVPQKMMVNEHLFAFANFTSASVDIAVQTVDMPPTVFRDVPFDSATGLGMPGFRSGNTGVGVTAPSTPTDLLLDHGTQIMNLACALSAADFLFAEPACVSGLLSVLADLAAERSPILGTTAGGVGLAMSNGQCVVVSAKPDIRSMFIDCGRFVTDSLESIADERLERLERERSVIRSLLLSLVRDRGPRVSASEFHTCMVRRETAYCWGENRLGQLGTGPSLGSFVPLAVSGDLKFKSISAGRSHTCAVTVEGQVFCWGRNGAGHLGNGSTIDSPTPVLIASEQTFITVSAGGSHTCGVGVSGHAYCWGNNQNGQLGDGTHLGKSVPTAVASDHIFVSVSTGFSHTCGLTTERLAYCWGDNTFGQLGDGTIGGTILPTRTTPTPVAGSQSFTSVSVHQYHSCGVTSDAKLFCWGNTGDGRLGNGTDSPFSGINTPVAVEGGLSTLTVDPGGMHTCGVTSELDAYCWGGGVRGQLGHGGSGPNVNSVVPVAVSGNLIFKEVSAGFQHTCGVEVSSLIYCWGSNGQGQLGDGSNTGRALPAPIRWGTDNIR